MNEYTMESNEKILDGQVGLDLEDYNDVGFTVNTLPDIENPVIIDEDGTPIQVAPKDDKEILNLLKPGKFDIKNFHDMFSNNTEEALMQLLSMQSNDSPLKKGGESIAYRCDYLLMLNRQYYNTKENTLLDIVMGYVSSHPDDKSYSIYPKDCVDKVNFDNDSYIYTIFKEATETLKNKPLMFEINNNGKKLNLAIPWYELLLYNDKDVTMEDAVFLSFTPSAFFKLLVVSSSITHGAYYNIGVASKLEGYVRLLFYYLSSWKNYTAYKGAPKGQIRVPIESFPELCKCPKSYRPTDINRRILEPAMEKINAIPENDFTFKYQMVKTTRLSKRKQYTDVDFFIFSKKSIVSQEPIPELSDMERTALQIIEAQGLSSSDAYIVFKYYQKHARDIVFLTQAIANMAKVKNIKSKKAYLCKIMENGLSIPKEKNNFHNFDERDVSKKEMSDLEKALLN